MGTALITGGGRGIGLSAAAALAEAGFDLAELGSESFDRCVEVNLKGTFFLTQAVARAMLGTPAPRTTYRSIITITSANADVIGMNRADYCMTKARFRWRASYSLPASRLLAFMYSRCAPASFAQK